jgi:hypothetical protein
MIFCNTTLNIAHQAFSHVMLVFNSWQGFKASFVTLLAPEPPMLNLNNYLLSMYRQIPQVLTIFSMSNQGILPTMRADSTR